MAAALAMIRDPRRSEYLEARRYAADRLRTRTPGLAQRFGLSPEHWREITHGDWPEIAGRWEEPRSDRPSSRSAN